MRVLLQIFFPRFLFYLLKTHDWEGEKWFLTFFFLALRHVESDTHILISKCWNSRETTRKKKLCKNHQRWSFAEKKWTKKIFFAKNAGFFFGAEIWKRKLVCEGLYLHLFLLHVCICIKMYTFSLLEKSWVWCCIFKEWQR